MARSQFKVCHLLACLCTSAYVCSRSRFWTAIVLKLGSNGHTDTLVYGPFSQSPSLLLFPLTAVSLSPQQVLLVPSALSHSLSLFRHLWVTMTEAFKPKSSDKRKVSTNGRSMAPPCPLSLSLSQYVTLSLSHSNSYYFYLLTWLLSSPLTAPSF